VPRLLSFAVLLATWWIGSLLAGDAKLPPPPTVFAAMIAEARSGNLFFHLGVTLARVGLAFTLAMALGAAIGYLMGRVRLADRLGDPWLILLLNLPALVVIVLAYIWAGLTEAAAIAAIAVNKLPTAVVTLRDRVDREVAPLHVLLERDLAVGHDLEVVPARAGRALDPGWCELDPGRLERPRGLVPRQQPHPDALVRDDEILDLPVRLERGSQLVVPDSRDDEVELRRGPSEQLVADGAADDVGVESERVHVVGDRVPHAGHSDAKAFAAGPRKRPLEGSARPDVRDSGRPGMRRLEQRDRLDLDQRA